MSVITRPPVVFNPKTHTYTLHGKKLAGISSVAKVGGALEAFSIASAWGFRIGYEGAFDVLCDATEDPGYWSGTKADLRKVLQARKLTPWGNRDEAADRGTWVHDMLEAFIQGTPPPPLTRVPKAARGHAESVMTWYIKARPEFVATEVMVCSERHLFAGRLDIRAKYSPFTRVEHNGVSSTLGEVLELERPILGLTDLKTSKGVYPNTHFPQLEGYELASTEMGFPATDARLILNSHANGDEATLHLSTATTDDFLAYLEAFNAIKRLTPPRRRAGG